MSFVSYKWPRKFIKHLKKIGLLIYEKEEGIYYIEGALFPMQLIHTAKLSPETNLWLRNLTKDLKESVVMDALMAEYQRHRHNGLYKSVMDIIIRANKKYFEEEKVMCQAIRELFWDEWVELEKGLEGTRKEIAERQQNIADMEEHIAVMKREIERGQREIERGQREIERGQREIEINCQKAQERLLLLIKKMTESGAAAQISRLYEEAGFLQEMYAKYQV